MTAPLPAGERTPLRTAALSVPVTAALGCLATTAAVWAAPSEVRVPLALAGGAAALVLCAAVALAVHGILSARLTRRRLESARQDVARLLRDQRRGVEESTRERHRLLEEFARERARVGEELDRERAELADAMTSERSALTGELLVERERMSAEFARITAHRAPGAGGSGPRCPPGRWAASA
ncbi:hypothetical protein ABS735_29815 [Streptomyces sp. MMCC 100]|uniref:hypothetical protein n=1 Tax=Streptomyces sp. MMCC 100 TaxID=3163555 RepID=UPI003598494E